MAMPLNTSISTSGPLPADNYQFMATPDSVPIEEGAFFKDVQEEILYSFAGLDADNQLATSTLYTYNVTSQDWGSVSMNDGDFSIGARQGALTANSDLTDEGLGFIFGGYDNFTGMIVFDSQTMEWKNDTDPAPPDLSAGSMVYTRYGSKGTLIALGGWDKDMPAVNANGPWYGFRSMANIAVYDVASSKWWNVTATGDVPGIREGFCSAVSYAPDNSSANIVIYGGFDNSSNTVGEETYILSIPSFRWINATANSNNNDIDLNGGNPVARRNMMCHMYQNRQLISLGGGLIFGGQIVNRDTCNASWPTLRVFDTASLTWVDSFTPDLGDYYVPDTISNVIGGNASGGATVTSPSNGFPAKLANVFQTMAPYYNASSSSQPPRSNQQYSNPVGAIAGGVVGGVVGLALILAMPFVLLRLRRRRHQHQQILEMEDSKNVGKDHRMQSATELSGSTRFPVEKQASDDDVLRELDGQQMHEMGSDLKPKAINAEEPSELPG